ncbi:MAG: VIT1/CCC1 transporter family protein [Xanthobacteraceae bacterium]|nr:VIT1/CCC1 transporter family protein [Xanthobacteraceae bacterium]
MVLEQRKSSHRLLDPVDRVTEVLFGLIMVLTSTNTLSVATAGGAEIGTMIIGALGCNLAWGIIDAALYVMGCLNERGRELLMLRALRQPVSPEEARRLIADKVPESLAAVLSPDEAEAMRQKLVRLPDPPPRPRLTRDDALSAAGICLLVFVSTFPVVIPFLFIDEVRPALRFSNAVAIAMMFLCGYVFARCTGLRPWPSGLLMVAIGCAMVGVAIALGG